MAILKMASNVRREVNEVSLGEETGRHEIRDLHTIPRGNEKPTCTQFNSSYYRAVAAIFIVRM